MSYANVFVNSDVPKTAKERKEAAAAHARAVGE